MLSDTSKRSWSSLRVAQTVLALLLTLWVNNARAIQLDTLRKNIHFEVSFGQSLLFISNSTLVNVHNDKNIVLPTASFLFFTELRTNKKVRIPVFFNLPTESKQFIVNGQPVYEKASPTLGTGLEFKLFQIKIDARSKIECEVGPLASVILDNKNSTLVPIIAGRFKIMRGENFLMYIGGSYTFGVNTLGMFYGTGSVF